MNAITISQKKINKHLSFQHYEYIVNSVIKFNAIHRSSKRNIGKTKFIIDLASAVGTSPSNIYSIIKDSTITVRDTQLKVHTELSALACLQ